MPFVSWLERLVDDLHFGLRVLRKAPAFSAGAILSLALALGAGTAIFSIVDTVFLRPLPYPNPGALAWVAIRFPSYRAEFVPSPDYVAWRRHNRTFEDLAATRLSAETTSVLNGTEPAEGKFAHVSSNFPTTLGVSPVLGRSFNAEEELPNGPRATILTDNFWRKHFGARREAIGKPLRLDGTNYQIIGVLPRSFVFPLDLAVDGLVTLPVSPTASHHDQAMFTWVVIGRLKPGVTVASAKSNLDELFARSKVDEPRLFGADARVIVEPLQKHRIGDARLLLLVLAGAVSFLLLIACANVANLLLARWSSRSGELAVRAALGAPRRRLVRHLFIEGCLLAFIGSLLGFGLTAITLRGIVHFAGSEIPRLAEVHLDLRVFAIGALLSVLTALLFGGLPALFSGRADVGSALQHAANRRISKSYTVWRRALITLEVASSIVLLSGAALLGQTLWHLQSDNLGFTSEHVLTVSMALRGSKFERRSHQVLAEDTLRFVRRLPGTEAAAFTVCTPPAGAYMDVTFTREDRPLPAPFHHGGSALVCPVGADYFKAVETPLLRGRFFSENDSTRPGTLAILNQAAVRAYLPDVDPFSIRVGGNRDGNWKQVVGIVADAKNQGLNLPPLPEIFTNDLDITNGNELTMVVRTAAAASAVEREILAHLHARDPTVYVSFAPLAERISQLTAGPRFNSVLLGSFAAIALALASLGIYALLAFMVTQRKQEIGIRMACGADRYGILNLFLREGVLLLTSGAIAGLPAALVLTRLIGRLLYHVTPTDLLTYSVILIVITAAALSAALIPARRAASLDPMVSLRHE
ncbi:MAG: ABC transporter permease [Acidobacteriota bacterium]|nr:ABC transporter permease [Acidobacteriota bacterium]